MAHACSPSEKKKVVEAIRTGRELPLKYCYLNSGAAVWDEIRTDPDYDLGIRELKTLSLACDRIASRIPEVPLSVVHLGVGNGAEIQTILDMLGGRLVVPYWLVDISEPMLAFALQRAKLHFHRVSFKTHVADVTSRRFLVWLKGLPKNRVGANLIVLVNNGGILASTTLLSTLAQTMLPTDRLLVTLELYRPERQSQILASYRVKSVGHLVQVGLRRIGVSSELKDFQTRYNRASSCVEIVVDTRQTGADQWKSLGLDSNELDKVVVLSCYRPSKNAFLNRLRDSGLQCHYFKFYPTTGCCACLLGRNS